MSLRLKPDRRARRSVSPAPQTQARFSPSIRSIRLAAPERFSVETSMCDGTRVIAAIGELDAAAVPLLEGTLLDSIGDKHAIVLDLERLTFVDSCGLWLITLTLSSCRRGGVAFAMTRGPESVRSVFELTGLSEVLPFVDASPAEGDRAPS